MKRTLKSCLAIVLVFIMLLTIGLPASAATKVKINYSKLTMYVGAEQQLKITGTKASVKWSSSSKNVVTVNKSGMVTAVKEGKATVKAKVGKTSKTCKITVKKPKLEKTKLSLYVGNNETVKLLGPKIKSATSSNKSVATVSKTGKITAKKAGTAKITIKGANNKKYTCTVTVKNVKLNYTKLSLYDGSYETLKLTGTKIKSVSTSDKSVATVLKSGKVTALKAGTAKITVKGTNGKKYYCNVTVKKTSINYTVLSIYKGSYTYLKLTGTKIKSVSTSNKSVVSAETSGKITALKAGTAKITVKGTNGKNYYCSVTVKEKAVKATSLSLNLSSKTLRLNESVVLTATIAPTNATNKTLDWSVSDTDILSIKTDNSGKATVTALKPGEAIVSVSATDGSNLKKTCKITVDSYVVVSTQEELSRALSMNLKTISIETDDETSFEIPESENKNTELFVNAPNAEVINNAVFNRINIEAIAENTYHEWAKGNTISWSALIGRLEVAENSNVSITVGGTESGDKPSISLVNNGKIDSLTIDTISDVKISGKITSESIPVDITSNAANSQIQTAQNLKINAESRVNLVLKKGAEETVASVSDDSCIPSVSGLGSVTIKDAQTGQIKDTVIAEKNDSVESWDVTVSGVVRNAESNEGISDISLYLIAFNSNITSNNIDSILTNDNIITTTDNSGKYSFNTPIGNYFLVAKAEGFITNIQTLCITSIYDTNYSNTDIKLAVDAGENGNIQGLLTDAFTGSPIDYPALLKLRKGTNNISGAPLTSIELSGNVNGQFNFYDLLPGAYTIQVETAPESETNLVATSFNVSVVSGKTVTANATVTKYIESSQVRFILRWGDEASGAPRDLDSHLVGPTGSGKGKFHTWYSDQAYYVDGVKFDDLDVDDVTWEGPETTTIYKKVDGVYSFYVYDFTNQGDEQSGIMSNNSSATVEIAEGAVSRQTFYIPTGKHGNLWHVCDYNAVTGIITPINEVKYWPSDGSATIGLERIDVLRNELTRRLEEIEDRGYLDLVENDYSAAFNSAIEEAKNVLATSEDEDAISDSVEALNKYINEISVLADSFEIKGDSVNNYYRNGSDIYIQGTAASLGEINIIHYNSNGDISVSCEDVIGQDYVKIAKIKNIITGLEIRYKVYYEIDESVFNIEDITGNGITQWNRSGSTLELYGPEDSLPDFGLVFNQLYADNITYTINENPSDNCDATVTVQYGNKTHEIEVIYYKLENTFDIINVTGKGITFFKDWRYAGGGDLYIYGLSKDAPEFDIQLRDEFQNLVTYSIEDNPDDSNRFTVNMDYDGNSYTYDVYYYLHKDAYTITNVTGNGIYRFEERREENIGYLDLVGVEETIPEFTFELPEEYKNYITTEIVDITESYYCKEIKLYYNDILTYTYRVSYYQNLELFNIKSISDERITNFDCYPDSVTGELNLYGFKKLTELDLTEFGSINFYPEYSDKITYDFTPPTQDEYENENYIANLVVTYDGKYSCTYRVYSYVDSSIYGIASISDERITDFYYSNSSDIGSLNLYGFEKLTELDLTEFDSINFNPEYNEKITYNFTPKPQEEYEDENYIANLVVTYDGKYSYTYRVYSYVDSSIYRIASISDERITDFDCYCYNYSDNGELYLYGFEKITDFTDFGSINFNSEYSEKMTYDFTPKPEADIDNYIANLVVTYDGKYSYTYRVYSDVDSSIYEIESISDERIIDFDYSNYWDIGSLNLYGFKKLTELDLTDFGSISFNPEYSDKITYDFTSPTQEEYENENYIANLVVTYDGKYSYTYRVYSDVDLSIYEIESISDERITYFNRYSDSDIGELYLYGFEKITDFTDFGSISFNPKYNEKMTYEFKPEEDIDNGYGNIANLVVTYDGKYSYTYRVYSYLDSSVYGIESISDERITGFDYSDHLDIGALYLYGSEQLTDLTDFGSINFNPEYGDKITYNFIPPTQEDIDNDYGNIANLVVTYDGKYSFTYRVYSYIN